MKQANPDQFQVGDEIQQGVLAFDQGLILTAWNPAMERLFGPTSDEVLGRELFEVLPFFRENGETEFFRNTIRGETTISRGKYYQTQEGTRIYYEAKYTPSFDAKGEVTGGMATIKKLEPVNPLPVDSPGLEETLDRISALFESPKLEDFEGAVSRALALMGRFSGYDRCYLVLLTELGARVGEAYEWCDQGVGGVLDEVKTWEVEEDMPWLTGLIQKGGPISLRASDDWPKHAELERRYVENQKITSLHLFPLRTAGGVIGLVGFDGLADRDASRQVTAERLTMVARIFSHSFLHADRQRQSRGIQGRPGVWLEKLPLTLMVMDCQNWQITYLNQENFLGFDLAGLNADHTFFNRVHPADADRVTQHWKQLVERVNADPVSTGCRMQHRDGTWVPLRCQSIVLSQSLTGSAREVLITLSDVTESENFQTTLESSRLRFKAMTEVAPLGVFVVDPRGYCVYINETFKQLTGLSFDQVQGTGLLEQLFPDEPNSQVKQWNNAASAGIHYEGVHAWNGGKGESLWLRTKTSAMQEKGEVAGFVGTIEDITAQRQAEESMIRSEKNQRIINYFATSLLGKNTLNEILNDITANCVNNLDFEDCAVFLLDEARDVLVEHAGYGKLRNEEQELIGRFDLPVGKGIVGHVAKTRKAEVVPDTNLDKRYVVDRIRRNSEMAVPILYEGNLIGVIDSEHSEIGFFTEDHLHVLQTIASLAANKIMHVWAEDRVKESLERVDLALEGGNLGLWDWDVPTGSMTYNERWAKMLGYELEEIELNVNNWSKVMHPEDKPGIMKALEDHLAGKTSYYLSEHRLQTKDGSWRWILDRGKVTQRDKDGNPLRVTGTHLDVTDRRMIEEKLRISLGQYRGLVSAVPDTMIRVTAEGRILDYKADSRHDPEEAPKLIGKRLRALNLNKTVSYGLRKMIREALSSGELQTLEYEREENGEVHSFEARVVKAGDGEAVCIIRDITERKLAEVALRESEDKFKSAFENASVGMVLSDVNGAIYQVNNAFSRMLGYQQSELLGKHFRDITLTSDIDQNLDLFGQLLRGEINSYHLEKGYVHKKGHTLTGLLSCSLVRDLNREPLFVIAQVKDITDRKNAERELRKLTDELLKSNAELNQFAYITSHNLRAPVVNLRSLLTLYNRSNPLDEENDLILEKLESSVELLGGTLEDLIQIVALKNEDGGRPETLNLSELLSGVEASISDQMNKQNVQVLADFSQAPFLDYPKSHLESIFLNFLTNAIKYRSPKRNPVIRVTSKRKDGYFCLSVRDNGLGIDLDQHGEELFGLYKRFHNHVEGKGIGLYIIRSQVENMGGRIDVTSSLGKGTTFTVHLRERSPKPEIE